MTSGHHQPKSASLVGLFAAAVFTATLFTAVSFTAIIAPLAAMAAADNNQTFHLGRHDEFTIQIKERTGDDFHKRLVVTRAGRVLLDQSAHDFALVDPSSEHPNLGFAGHGKIKLFDLTGDGINELIVRQWTGGAHCCYTYDIYSLNHKFSHIGHFALGDGHMLTMRSNRPSQPILIFEDAIFRYWRSGVYEFPKVPMVWRRNKFVVDLSAIKKLNAVKLDDQLIDELKVKSSEKTWEPLYHTLVQLYFSGRADKARQLMERFHAQDESATELRKSFVNQLRRSQFYKAVRESNGGAL